MQRWNMDQSQNRETGKQGWAKSKYAEPAKIDHEAKNAGEPSPLAVPEPGRVDFYHARRAEGLHVTVQASNGDKQTEHSRERSGTKKDVHDDCARRADEHRFFASDMVRQQSINDLPARIGEQCRGDDIAHLGAGEPELFADRLVGNREVVPAHVERRV